MGWLKKMFSWLTNRWVLSVLGLVILCLVIWYVGQILAFGDWMPLADDGTRGLFIALVVLVWAVIQLLKVVRQKKANQQIIQGMSSSARQDSVDNSEVALLKDRFQEAMQTLKKSRLGGNSGRRYLYQLPWYVIIGPPGAGKTTALKNSGLRFPLQEGFGSEPLKGIGGTRNCDWWFTNEAVLLDTAGRYTTQDSDQSVDKEAWTGFLGLLKKYRRRRPLDGVIVAFSLMDLIAQSAETRQLHAMAVRRRLKELSDSLKVQVPVYVIFTKTDLLEGFTAYFDNLDKTHREQVWGMTFPLSVSENPSEFVTTFSKEYEKLISRLEAGLIERLDAEQDLHRRAALHGFPEQMASLKLSLRDFIAEIFAPNVYDDKPMLRGVYFSSGTQEGTPIDRLIGAVSRAFGLSRQATPAYSGPGRSYFLTRLMQDVIFKEAGLVVHTGFWSKHRGQLERAGYFGALAATLLVIVGWFWSYQHNLDYIHDVEEQLGQYQQVAGNLVDSQGDINVILPYLNLLRTIPGGYADKDISPPLSMGLGLYQGDKLGPIAIDAYRRALNNVLLPRVVTRLEQQLSENNRAEQSDLLYAALKVYLMIGNPGRYDREEVGVWITTDWANQYPGVNNSEPREQLVAHLQALVDSDLPQVRLQGLLVEQVRQTLAKQSLAERVYGQIKRGPQASKLNDWRMIDSIGADAAHYFRFRSDAPMNKGLPGFFTLSGYKDVLLKQGPQLTSQAAKETWVLREDSRDNLSEKEVDALFQDVSKLYFSEYVRVWQDYLADLDIARFNSFADGAQKVKDLSAEMSPIRSLLAHVGKQTTLVSSSADLIDAAGKTDRLSGISSRVSALLSKAAEADSLNQNTDPAALVDRQFARLHEILKERDEVQAPIKATLSNLNELFIALSTVEATINSAAMGLSTNDASSALQGVLRRIQLEANRQPEPLRQWLYSLVRESNMVFVRDARQRFNKVWQSSVASFCRQAIDSRYPIAHNSPDDINISDFSRYFGPSGLLDEFFKTYLAGFIDTSVKPWRLIENAGAKLEVDDTVVDYFEQAADIRQTFFMGGANQPYFNFQIIPLQLDASASQSLIELGDQRLVYQHGPTRLTQMVWPPSGGLERARFSIRSLSGNSTGIATDGPWAWFRLIDKGNSQATSTRDRFRVTFNAEGLEASYEIKAGSVINPFNKQALRSLGCLDSL
ncbi:type VI secretion system membrane subunit TssM [Bowmanella denitrificans]|uniref:type VI secretion system membrane subunit TssM n=1 Tax=Bowmanella denitrificans TaxID=366582 RepID=UPI000C9ACAF5|nr:type VI secretion system membrane subunit TssM [Bowmanella denitrificans]